MLVNVLLAQHVLCMQVHAGHLPRCGVWFGVHSLLFGIVALAGVLSQMESVLVVRTCQACNQQFVKLLWHCAMCLGKTWSWIDTSSAVALVPVLPVLEAMDSHECLGLGACFACLEMCRIVVASAAQSAVALVTVLIMARSGAAYCSVAATRLYVPSYGV
jgi:hypothetical protein